MAFLPESRSGLILAIFALTCGGCGASSAEDGGSTPASAGKSSGAGAPGTGGTSGVDTDAGGGTLSANAGDPSVSGGAAAAAAGPGSAGAPSAAGTGSGAGGANVIPTVPYVYVGSTNGQISIFTLDAALGKLTLVKSVAAGNYPSYLAFDPMFAHLYAVNEPDGKVACFAVDSKTGDLTFLNRVDSGGAGPAFLSVDHSGKYLLVANYEAGTTRVSPLRADGSVGPPSDDKSPGKNSHMIVTDPGNQFAFVVNKGSDTISQYAFNPATGTLSPNDVPSVVTPAGSGPRHLAFHPNGKFAYLIAENADTLSAYAYDPKLGRLTFLESKSTLPAGENGDSNTCAEVVVAPSGKFVYGSNRGHDSIARFSIDTATGKLTFIDTTPSGGNVPRSFTISRDGELMLVANESGNVTSFSVDTKTGALTTLLSLNVPQKPQFVGIADLPL
ncbi:MAG TPA: lactonase family protein [Polyangiaceae bacterium]|nr:lactonase family protein [Polyangiaceae bacterium]